MRQFQKQLKPYFSAFFALTFLFTLSSCAHSSNKIAPISAQKEETSALASSRNIKKGYDSSNMTDKSAADSKQNPVVEMTTSLGTIKIELYPDKAPITVQNFLDYVKEGFYNGTIFHRVIPNFMIQGGGFTPDMNQKPTRPPIKNEADNGLKNLEGTIAMARTNEINSATSQFFINTANNYFLDHRNDTPEGYGYAVFGKVISGMAVAHKIEHVQTKTIGPFQDVPVQPVVIESVKIEK
jgi:cyclophilin family peptidyl-prolyl cis-trans isomerase